MKKIVCFHLYNDYSGSPRVLAMILKGLQKKGYSIDIITSNGGILNQLMYSDRIKFKFYKYHFSTNKWHTTLSYLFIQLYTFIWSFKYLFKKDIVFYRDRFRFCTRLSLALFLPMVAPKLFDRPRRAGKRERAGAFKAPLFPVFDILGL